MQATREEAAALVRRSPRWASLLSCIRFDEVLILQGTPLLGALFSMDRLTLANASTVALLVAGSVFLVAHVFALNDWSGMSADLRDPNRTSTVFVNRGVARARVAYLCIALLAFGLVLLGALGTQSLLIALAIAALSALYSAPAAHIKGVPILNSLLHFAGGLLHFLLGYSVFRAPDGRGLEIGCFLALVFTAGHLTHEARDSDVDRLNGIRTNAVCFGKERNFIAGLVLFTAADLLLAALVWEGIMTLPLIVLAALYLLHLYWSWRTMQGGLTFDSLRGLQTRYRLRYAAIGLLLAWTAIGAR